MINIVLDIAELRVVEPGGPDSTRKKNMRMKANRSTIEYLLRSGKVKNTGASGKPSFITDLLQNLQPTG